MAFEGSRAEGGGEDLETLQVLLGVLLFRAVIGLGALSAVGWRISKIRDKIRFWCCFKRAETEIPRTQWPKHGRGAICCAPSSCAEAVRTWARARHRRAALA